MATPSNDLQALKTELNNVTSIMDAMEEVWFTREAAGGPPQGYDATQRALWWEEKETLRWSLTSVHYMRDAIRTKIAILERDWEIFDTLMGTIDNEILELFDLVRD